MKLISKMAAVGAVFAFLAPAVLAQRLDITEPSTPKAGEQFSVGLTFSGKTFALHDISIFETYFNLPFGLDFKAGHGFVFGMEITPGQTPSKILGYQVYFIKNVGGDGGGLRIAPMIGINQHGESVEFLLELRIDATFRF